jgi:hypothetical protein
MVFGEPHIDLTGLRQLMCLGYGRIMVRVHALASIRDDADLVIDRRASVRHEDVTSLWKSHNEPPLLQRVVLGGSARILQPSASNASRVKE